MKKAQTIQNRIYDVRGQKVMLDFDLAELYEVETRALNQAGKRNNDLFSRGLHVPTLSKRMVDDVITSCDDIPL